MKRKHPTVRLDLNTAASCVALLASLSALQPASVLAAPWIDEESTDLENPPVVSSHEPVLLEAERIDYNHEDAIVTASGNVKVVQGETVVLSDLLSYDQKTNTITAIGNVGMLDPSGHLYFADELEFTDDLKTGVISQFRARLVDNSLFAAVGAEKIDENRLELYKAAYTPCKCEDSAGNPITPMWQVRAKHVLIDEAAQNVVYDDAYFKVYDMPVFYTPYFSHPTPGADNQSGLLMPEFLHSDNLGSVYRQPIYYSIAPDKDVTLTPMFTGREGMVMIGEYRQAFDSGTLFLDGSVTRPQERAGLARVAGHEVRGHFNGIGQFAIAPNYNWGFDIHRVTDDTYLRRYSFSNDTLLTSKIYVEGFNFIEGSDRTYATAQGLAFQGLTGQDDPDRVPIVMPLADFTWQSVPGWNNSRFSFDGNAMVLYRDIGPQSRRLSGTMGWKLPYISDDGQIIEFTTQLRSDVYEVTDVLLSDGRNFDGVTGRVVPEASLLWRYPFINRWEESNVMMEPIVQFAISPGGGNPEKIPNEDSLVPEFTDTNLFASNRFAGLDRIENGPRMSYGMRGQAQYQSDKYVDWLFGQHYRIDNDRNFPFTNDLVSHFSDYVGKVGINVLPLAVAYRFRLDKGTFAAKRNEVDGSFNYYPIGLYSSYLSLKNDPVLANKEVVVGGGTVNLTREWSWNVSGSHDLLLDQTDAIATGLMFENECVNVTTMIGRDYTNLLDVKPSTTFWIRVSLKNLE